MLNLKRDIFAATARTFRFSGLNASFENQRTFRFADYSITILASAMIKNTAYRYEEESRLVSFKQDENDVKYKLSSTKKLLPYIHVAISTSKLKKIVIGPCCDYNNIKFALKKRLEQLGIPLKDEDIEKSIVPFRIF